MARVDSVWFHGARESVGVSVGIGYDARLKPRGKGCAVEVSKQGTEKKLFEFTCIPEIDEFHSRRGSVYSGQAPRLPLTR